MSEETHEQIIEHRSVFTVDDALVVTTISETDTPVCGTCWRYVQHDDEQETTEYVRAPWPCENARLRERVAALEAIADGAFDDVVRVVAGTAEYESAEWRVRLTLLLPKLSAALAQADETGGAR